MTEIVRLSDDVTWIFECHEVGDRHMHVSQYVVRTEDNRFVLVDAGLEYEEYLKDAILRCTDGRGIDALLLTHSILPHTRSANEVQADWEDVSIITAASSGPIVGIYDADSKVLNSTRAVVGREFTFMDPLLTDVVNSNWIFDTDARTLFTAEGLGHYHSPGSCALTSSDMDGGIPDEHVHAFHVDKLPFLQYLDVDKLRDAIETIFGNFDVECIAPAHGNPVRGADVDRYLDRVLRSAEALSAAEGNVLVEGDG